MASLSRICNLQSIHRPHLTLSRARLCLTDFGYDFRNRWEKALGATKQKWLAMVLVFWDKRDFCWKSSVCDYEREEKRKGWRRREEEGKRTF